MQLKLFLYIQININDTCQRPLREVFITTSESLDDSPQSKNKTKQLQDLQ